MKRALLALVLAGCGGPELEPAPEPAAPPPLQVVLASAAPWAAAPDAEARVRARVELALAYWHAPAEVLDGWSLIVSDEVLCGTNAGAGGCARYGANELEVSTEFGPCAEAAPIAHEVGHAVLGPEAVPHSDPRWSGLLEAGLAAGAYHCP